MKRIATILLALILTAVWCASARAEAPPSNRELESFYGRIVDKIDFDIPVYMDAKMIKRASKIKEGKSFSRWRCRKTLRSMYLVDTVENVAIRVTPVGEDRVKVMLKIYPVYILRDIRVVGNFTFNVNEILDDILRIEPGDNFREDMISDYKKRIREAYKREGHLKVLVKIDWQLTKRKDDNKADLRIKINERPTYRIVNFDFTGARLGVYKQEEILKIAKWKAGMAFTEDGIQDGLKRLKKWLKENGHLEARLPDLDMNDPQSFTLDEVKSDVVMHLPIVIGSRIDVIYREECFSCAEQKWKLDDILGIENQRRFNKWIARDFSRKVRLFLQRQGYFNAKVKGEFRRYTEPNGMRVKEIVISANRGEKVKIRSIDFKENPSYKDDELKSLLSNTSIYVEADFDEDLKNVINHYNSNGFLQTKIAQKIIDYDDMANVIDIIVVLDEGPRTYVRSIKFNGNTVVDEQTLFADLQEEQTRMVVGEPFNPFILGQVRAALLSHYLTQGYVKARVKDSIIITEDETGAEIEFNFVEGRQFFFGEIYYKGNKLTKSHVIERELVVVEGRPYNFEKIFRSEQALVQLGFFNSVNIHPVSEDFDEERVDMMIEVGERKNGYMTGGIGYNTYNGFRGAFEIGHRNLAGHGRHLSFRVDTFVTDMSFAFDQHITAVSFTWPWIARVPLDGTFTIRDSELNEIAYDVRTFSLTFGTTMQWMKMLNFLDATHPNEKVREFAGSNNTHLTFDPFTTQMDWELAQDYIYNIDQAVSDQERGEVTITTLSPMIMYDKRDNMFNPTRWTYDSLRFDYGAPYLLSQISYLKVTGRSSWYLPIFEALPFLKGWVFGENFVVGHAQVLRETDTIPISRRFFLGGSTTLRGFGQNEISPTGDDGKTPVGGYFMAYQQTELRLPLGESGLGLLLFFDAGNVTNGTNTFYIDKMRATSGFGLRYLTPIGPVSGDVGFKLNCEPDESIYQAYLTIGNAF